MGNRSKFFRCTYIFIKFKSLTHFSFPFFIPWKYQKTFGFLVFSEGAKIGTLARNGLRKLTPFFFFVTSSTSKKFSKLWFVCWNYFSWNVPMFSSTLRSIMIYVHGIVFNFLSKRNGNFFRPKSFIFQRSNPCIFGVNINEI